MHNMVNGGTPSVIVPPQLKARMLRLEDLANTEQDAWYRVNPMGGFYPLTFNQSWNYNDYVYIGLSAEQLAHYRFIGEPVEGDASAFHLERIVGAAWLAAHRHESQQYQRYAEHAHIVEFGTDTPTIRLAPADEQPPAFPSGLFDAETFRSEVNGRREVPVELEPFLIHHGYFTAVTWGNQDPVPYQLRDKLLPIYDVCSGNTLPDGFYQLEIPWNGTMQCYLYIDVPDDTLKDWALLGRFAEDTRRGGAQFLDIHDIVELPLTYGANVAHTVYREPATGCFAVQRVHPQTDTLIRGQIAEVLADVPNAGWSETDEENFGWKPNHVERGDTVVISCPGQEIGTYRVYVHAPNAEKPGERRRMVWEDIDADVLRVKPGEREMLEAWL